MDYDIDKLFIMGYSLSNLGKLYKPTDFDKEEGLKNEVVDNILKLVGNPKNAINLSVPINMNAQQKAAKQSALGKAEKIVTSDNPATKFKIQEQAMGGKAVIGITAVSMKAFFGLSNYNNITIDNITQQLQSGDYNNALRTLNSLVFADGLSNEIRVLANLNWKPLLSYINANSIQSIPFDSFITADDEYNSKFKERWKRFINGDQFDIATVVNLLSSLSNVSDASLILSGILSSATDFQKYF